LHGIEHKLQEKTTLTKTKGYNVTDCVVSTEELKHADLQAIILQKIHGKEVYG
jgi:hypothetical protein